MWGLTRDQAKAFDEYLRVEERNKAQWELSKMELLAGFLGVEWKAPEMEGPCSPDVKAACLQKYGDNLAWACENCPRQTV